MLGCVAGGSHDEVFTTAFARMEKALNVWPSLPADANDPLKVDRRVSDRLIAAAGPAFRVVWWRVIEALGRVPHSDEAHRTVPVTIYRCRSTAGRMGNEVAPFYTEARKGGPGVESLVINCKVAVRDQRTRCHQADASFIVFPIWTTTIKVLFDDD